MTPAELIEAQRAAQAMHASDALLDYLQALIQATRSGRLVRRGPVAARRHRRAARGAGPGPARRPRLRRPRRRAVRAAADDRASPHARRRRRPRPGRAGARHDRRRCLCLERGCRPQPQPGACWCGRAFAAGGDRACHAPTRQTLTQGNVYILPTRAGWMFGLTLLVLLLASVNYQLNLGYMLTFLLAGSGVVSMHITHGTLRGLTLHLRAGGADLRRRSGDPRHRPQQPGHGALRHRPARARGVRGDRWPGSTFPPAARRRRTSPSCRSSAAATRCRR